MHWKSDKGEHHSSFQGISAFINHFDEIASVRQKKRFPSPVMSEKFFHYLSKLKNWFDVLLIPVD